MHPSNFSRFARQLQVLFKRAAPESLDNPPAKILRILILRNSDRARIIYSINFAFSFVPPPLIKRRRRIFTDSASIPNTPHLLIRENELLIVVTLSLTPALVNNIKKSRKEQLKEGISPPKKIEISYLMHSLV